MTISNTSNSVRYEGNGITSSFEFTFPLIQSNLSDLFVYLIDIDISGVETSTLLTLNTNYTTTLTKDVEQRIESGFINVIDGVGDPLPLTINQAIFIQRMESLTQETDIRNNQLFPYKTIEDTFDKLIAIEIQQQKEINKSLKLNNYTTATLNDISTPIDRKALIFVDNGDGSFNVETSTYDPDEQVADATAQAVIATTQAGIATTQAGLSSGYATQSMGYRDEARVWAEDYKFNLRNIGEIVQSTLPLTDAGLHLLDGSLILAGGSYDAFYLYMKDLYDDGGYTYLFETEVNWQASVSTYGVCGKFVFEDGISVRLPKIEGFTEGTITPSSLGDLTEAGLPNITGTANTGSTNTVQGSPSGALTYTTTVIGAGGGAGNDNNIITSIDASLSNSIYGNSTTVQPQSIKVLYYIVVATSIKTDIVVDIDQIATDLNGKADVDLANLNTAGESKILTVAMPLPKLTAGIGQIYNAYGVGTQTLPAGGTWYYLVLGYNSSTAAGFNDGTVTYSGIAAGGSTVGFLTGASNSVNLIAIRIA